MKNEKSSGSSKSLPSSTPTSKPLTKEDLAKVKIERSYGVKDLIRYRKKLKQNILVFKQAIDKEKEEIKRVEGMIKVLKQDIKQATSLQKLIK